MKKIIMFTTETWPHCHTAKSYLREKGYAFESRDVNKDQAANADFSRRGLRGVPAFIIGDDLVEGLDTKKIESLMDYEVIDCRECKKRLRVPKNKGKIVVRCPKCKSSFEKDTGNKK